jgi:hypothetical protein
VAEPIYRDDVEALEGAIDTIRFHTDLEVLLCVREEIEAIERAIIRLKADRDKEQP